MHKRGILFYGAIFSFPLILIGGLIINPYNPDGSPKESGTHTQLLMPPCIFKSIYGLPCAGCGLTTSCSLAIRGDILWSLAANPGGFYVLGVSLISFLRAVFLVINKSKATEFDKAIFFWVALLFSVLILIRWFVFVILPHVILSINRYVFEHDV